MTGFFKRKKAQEPDSTAVLAGIWAELRQIKAQGEKMLLHLHQMAVFSAGSDDKLGLFLEKQGPAMSAMEKYFKAQASLAEKQTKAIEEIIPTEDDKRF